jgi:hypothetical protein
VDGWERLAVHRPGEQDFGPARLVERDRPTEVLGQFRYWADVGALEADVRGVAERARESEHV